MTKEETASARLDGRLRPSFKARAKAAADAAGQSLIEYMVAATEERMAREERARRKRPVKG